MMSRGAEPSEKIQTMITIDDGLSAVTSILGAIMNLTESQVIDRITAYELSSITQDRTMMLSGPRFISMQGKSHRKSIRIATETKDRIEIIRRHRIISMNFFIECAIDAVNLRLGETYGTNIDALVTDIIRLQSSEPANSIQVLLKYIACGDDQ